MLCAPLFWCLTGGRGEEVGGGGCPIADRCTLHRLVAKIAGQMVDMGALLSPRQLGYGVKGGAVAAVHAAGTYLEDLPSGHALLKLDFKNAFNSVRRDKMLEAVQVLAPDIPIVYSAYSSPSLLRWETSSYSQYKECSKGTLWAPFFSTLPCASSL